jgi:hypothetical protein
MPKRADVLRWIAVPVIGAFGTLGVVGLSLGMNAQLERSRSRRR